MHSEKTMSELTNGTIATHDETDAFAWVIVPVILGLLIYMTLALFVWPYARPVVSPWLLLFCILFPPFFPFLLFFVLFTLCFPPVIVASGPSEVRVVERQEVYVVERQGRVRAPAQQGTVPSRRMGGSSV